MSYGSERVKAWRHRTKQKMVDAMGGACQCCGYDTCKEALAFHHIDPEHKDFGFGNLRANPAKWEKIVEELRKCVIVCHNCHSEIHAGVRQLPNTYTKFSEEYADWRKIEEYNNCLICDKEKPVRQKFCSHKCARLIVERLTGTV
jgi:hypothetical protein